MDGIPDLVKAYAGGVARWALSGVLGHLVAANIITGDNAAETITWAGAALATLAWSLYQKYKTQKALDAAKGE